MLSIRLLPYGLPDVVRNFPEVPRVGDYISADLYSVKKPNRNQLTQVVVSVYWHASIIDAAATLLLAEVKDI